jgi:hypothetical protein
VADAVTTPLILDASVLVGVARGDSDIIGLIQALDGRGQPLVVPALASAGASLDARSDEADDLLAGLELLVSATAAPLSGAGQAARLASIIARTDLDPWDAHVAAIGDAASCPILTLNAAKWQRPSADLDQPLHIIEISDPGDQSSA